MNVSSELSPQSALSAKGLIFDFDGLILDTETAVYEGWRELYQEHGHELPIETWVQCVGSDFGNYDPAADLETLVGRTLDWGSLTTRRRVRVSEILTGQQPLPGVRERLHEAQELGLRCAVASSSPREWVEPWLEKLHLRSYFDHVTTLDDTGKAKPDPSLFLHAAEKLGIDPKDLIVFEDSLNGLRAAEAAGMRCVIVPCPVTAGSPFTAFWQRLTSLNEVTLETLLRLELASAETFESNDTAGANS